jgi:polyphenol oxidase
MAAWVGIPEWQGMEWLRAGFSARRDGGSQAYGRDELNLGWTAEDAPEIVAANRRMFLKAVGGGTPEMPLVTVRQVHGASVVDLEGAGEDGDVLSAEPAMLMTAEGRARLEGDGLVTRTPGLWVGVITADCTPVLLVDVRQRAVGAFHAGWRGTVAGIVREGVSAMVKGYGSRLEDLRAAIGPCIAACCFEVGGEVVEQFRTAFGPHAAGLILGQEAGGATVNLQAANRAWLTESGVPAAHIVTVEGCTACARDEDGRRRFFSHRAERGVTGRMLSVAGVVLGRDS